MGEGAKKSIEKKSPRRKEKTREKEKSTEKMTEKTTATKERKEGKEKKEKKARREEEEKRKRSNSSTHTTATEAKAVTPSLSAALASLARPSSLGTEEESAAVVALFSTPTPAPLPSVAEVVSSFKAPTTKAQKRKRSASDAQPLLKRLKTSDDPAEIAKALDEQAVRAGEIRRAKKQQAKEDEHKTVFVGNVALTVTRKTLKKHFEQYGQVKTVRLRSLPIGTMKLTRKACAITSNFHEQRSSCNAYVVFDTIEEAIASLASNGLLLEGKHIRVDRIIHSTKDNRARDVASIFIGNLPFDVEEEELWSLFGSCGDIDGVRVVRDKVTNQGKGIAYVAFKDGKASVATALKKFSGGAKLRGRELRLEKIAKRSKLAKPEEKKRNREAALKRAQKKQTPLGGVPTGRPVQGAHVKAGKMRRAEAPSYQGKMAQQGKIPRMKLAGDKGKKYKAKPAKKKKTVRSGKR